jgi:ABC-type multidrug transport system ATPase subunit
VISRSWRSCADDLTKHDGDEAAVANVSFSVAAGEMLGIVGGKTTLLEVL